jgi:hypothetical protein
MNLSFSSSPWYSYTISSTSSYSPQDSFTPTYTAQPSFTPTYTAQPSFIPTYTAQPSITSTYTTKPLVTNSPLAQMQPQNRNILANLSDDAVYGILCAIAFVIIYSTYNATHYYTAYKNEKMRKRVADNVTFNPYHASVRDLISRV